MYKNIRYTVGVNIVSCVVGLIIGIYTLELSMKVVRIERYFHNFMI